MQAAADELAAQGIAVEPLRIDEYTGRRFTFFADPDGLPLELYEAATPDDGLDALLLKLEGSLHLREARASAAQLEELLDDDFRELGISGTEWTRPAIIEALRGEAFSERTISDFRVQRIAPGVALATYRVHRAATPVRPGADSLRSSLWRLRLGKWRMLPPTANLRLPDAAFDLDLVRGHSREAANLRYVLSNSFAFGGTNAVLIAGRLAGD